jgi:UDP-N-acetylmuramate dehydrogenase
MSLIEKFPSVRGDLKERAEVGKKSFFGVGGCAEILFIPKDIEDLVLFLENLPEETPITILGAMSNVLIRSGGIEGVVIILGERFGQIFVEDDVIEVGSAVHCAKLSAFAMDNELGGFEFLMGIPGTVGGALKMNAGCYGSEISNVFVECEGVDFSGRIRWLRIEDVGFGYRTSKIPNDLIVTRAWFRGARNVNYSISKKINEINLKRKDSQPLNQRSCGSTFKNSSDKKAWELIEAAGCRGMKVGGAAVSEKHCNFIVNENNATADDVEDLGELIIRKVLDHSGIRLEWEIARLGKRSERR